MPRCATTPSPPWTPRSTRRTPPRAGSRTRTTSPRPATQQTLLLLHGFPSTSADWHKQVAYFTARGYGALVPDMLGYGGTDKPTLAELDTLRPSLMAADMLELLEKEHAGRAVSIGHDWGSMVNSRVAQLFSARFDGFGYLALGYMPPNPTVDLHQVNALTKQHLGYEVFGYAFFHAEPGAADLIEAHVRCREAGKATRTPC
jgi:soluble epoxide hydrolase/lipid-phosphate phosphatase